MAPLLKVGNGVLVACCTRALRVDELGDDFFSCSALAGNEDLDA